MEAQKQPEPTMEEILASIRRIISEDGQPADEAAEAAAPEDGPDILELTDVVNESEPGAAAPAPARAPGEGASVQDEIDAIMNMEAGPAQPPAESRADPVQDAQPPASARGFVPAPEPESPPAAGDGLLSPAAASASGAALAGLVGAFRGRHELSGSMPVGGATLEELVRELLRPMLKEWLDANLPDMVERLVQREIERIARRAEER